LRKCLMRNTRFLLAPSIVILALQIGSKALGQSLPTSTQISITPANKQSVTAGSHEWFTDDVQVRALFRSRGTKPDQRRPGEFPARSTVSVAYASVRADLDHHRWNGVGSGMGWPRAGDAQRRCHLDSRRREALARSDADYSSHPCDSGDGERLSRHMDGTGHGRTVSAEQVNTDKKARRRL